MAVTYQLITHYHNRRGVYTGGTYHAQRCQDIHHARALARSRWLQHSRKGCTAHVTYLSDNGQRFGPQTFTQN